MKPNRRPFSVLLSLYARERADWFAASLHSLCTQSLQADEVVLVLDGRIGEELQQVIREFQPHLPLKVVPLKHHVGLGHALNQGLMQCRHEWVLRMDTDDISDTERFARQWRYIEQHPQLALFSGQIAEFSMDPAKPERLRSVPLSCAAIQQYARWRNPLNHMAVAYRKSVIQSVGGYCHHQGMEDYNLWLRVLAQGYEVHNLADILVYVRAGTDLYQRRRGYRYILSEWQLLQLKRRLRIQPLWSALSCFALRSASRLLPVGLLRPLYQQLRHNKQ
ncbi:glycosyltransferase [Neisseriaceae bacterium ESL0693]|nr:glycosyltransferase [Neisseriaceae bacterium ESL0693]